MKERTKELLFNFFLALLMGCMIFIAWKNKNKFIDPFLSYYG